MALQARRIFFLNSDYILGSFHFLPPQAVKSHLVWKAKSVSASETAAQTPTAIMMASASNLDTIVPNMKPSAAEKQTLIRQ
jgi:hypothetical protein